MCVCVGVIYKISRINNMHTVEVCAIWNDDHLDKCDRRDFSFSSSLLDTIAMYAMMRMTTTMTRYSMSELERSKVISFDPRVHVNVKWNANSVIFFVISLFLLVVVVYLFRNIHFIWYNANIW